MPGTFTASLELKLRSVLGLQGMCNANITTSLDSITVAHQLGQTPNEVRITTRSIISTASNGFVGPSHRSSNASQSIFDLPANPGVGATACISDFVFEVTSTIVQ